MHTPGPWEADVELGCVAAPNDPRAPNGKRIVVADTEYIGYEGRSPLTDEERAANTRIMAAAPDLHEALDSAVSWILLLLADAPPLTPRGQEMLNSYRAALSKASQQQGSPQAPAAGDK